MSINSPSFTVGDVPVPFTNCTQPSDLAEILSVTTNVWPPVRGTPLSISAIGILKVPVQDGYFTASASFDGIPVYNKKEDLSKIIHLPIAAGTLNITKTVKIPVFLPSGTIAIQASANNADGTEILCIQLQTSF